MDAQRGERLRSERARLGWTQGQAAATAGVRREQWVKYEAGAEPGATVLSRLAKAGFDVLYVLSGDSPAVRQSTPINVRWNAPDEVGHVAESTSEYSFSLRTDGGARVVHFTVVPKLDAKASAGSGADNGDADAQLAQFAIETDWMKSTFGRAGTDFAFVEVQGRSMEPTLRDGDSVLVDLKGREVGAGGVFVLRHSGELLVKRLEPSLSGSTVEVISDNSAYRNQTVSNPESLEIVGRVVWPRVR